jgi:hypothetical protein
LPEELKDIYGDIYVEERASGGPPCGSAVYICGYVGPMIVCVAAGERERERERERGRETTLRKNNSTSKAHQSIDTTSKKL